MIKGPIITLRAHNIPFVILAASIIALGSVIFLSRTALAKQLDDWQVIPKPERFTELYFADYHVLPTVLKTDVEQKLSFTVHNVERQTTLYLYQISSVTADTGAIKPLDNGSLTLLSGQTQTINQIIAPLNSSKRVAIRVDLSYKGIAFGKDAPVTEAQSIQYWISVLDPPHMNKIKQAKHATK